MGGRQRTGMKEGEIWMKIAGGIGLITTKWSDNRVDLLLESYKWRTRYTGVQTIQGKNIVPAPNYCIIRALIASSLVYLLVILIA